MLTTFYFAHLSVPLLENKCLEQKYIYIYQCAYRKSDIGFRSKIEELIEMVLVDYKAPN